MHSDPATWHALLGTLADTTITFLQAQLRAGVDAIQLFDSWAGALSLAEYREFVLPALRAGVRRGGEREVPRIHFGVGTGELLGAMGEAGADVVGVDWRIPLDVAARRVGPGKALQGNLDPAVLFAGPAAVETRGPPHHRGSGRRPRRRRHGTHLQPRARRAARHRSGRADRGGRAGAFAVTGSSPIRFVVDRRRHLRARRRVPAAARLGADARIVGRRRRAAARRQAAHGGSRRRPVDVGAEAFVARRPEVPALLAELGLADQLVYPAGLRPLIWSEDALHPLPRRHPDGDPAGRRRRARSRRRPTLARIAAEPDGAVRLDTGRGHRRRCTGRRPVRRAGGRSGRWIRFSEGCIRVWRTPSACAPRCRLSRRRSTAAPRACPRPWRTPSPPPTPGPVFGALRDGYGVLLRRPDGGRVGARSCTSGSGTRPGRRRLVGQIRWAASTRSSSPCPPRSSPTLLAGIAPRASAAAADIPLASSAVVALALPVRVDLPQNSGILVATDAALGAKAFTLSSRKWPHLAERERDLVRASFGRFGDAADRRPRPTTN